MFHHKALDVSPFPLLDCALCVALDLFLHVVESLDDDSDEEIQDKDMAHNHVNDEVDDHGRIVVSFRLHVHVDAVNSLVHHDRPAFICHKDHQVECRVQKVVKVIRRIFPFVAMAQTICLRRNRETQFFQLCIVFGQLGITVDHTAIEGSLEHVEEEDGEDDDHDQGQGHHVKNLLPAIDNCIHGDS